MTTIPGTPTYTGLHAGGDAVWEHLRYDLADLDVDGPYPVSPDPRLPAASPGHVDWYDFRGLGDTAGAAAFAARAGLPPLAVEDALDVAQRPKFEARDPNDERPASRLLVVPHLSLSPAGALVREHVTLFWTDHLVVSLQEYPTDLFAGVRERLRDRRGRLRERRHGYLAYALADVVVDGYADVLAALGAEADALEDDLFEGRALDRAKRRIHRLKATANALRSTLVALREAVTRWMRTEPVDEPKLAPFLRDLLDNVARALDLADAYAQRASDLYALYTSELAAGTNEVVQTLTVVSAIFIPLTFLAGIYGMNFAYIPELQARYGYFVLLAVMAAITIALLAYFRRKGWL